VSQDLVFSFKSNEGGRVVTSVVVRIHCNIVDFNGKIDLLSTVGVLPISLGFALDLILC
jgi:hypothetical protein